MTGGGSQVLALPARRDYHTVAGFALAQLGRFPRLGGAFEFGSWRFEVIDIDRRRIDKVLAQPLHKPFRSHPEVLVGPIVLDEMGCRSGEQHHPANEAGYTPTLPNPRRVGEQVIDLYFGSPSLLLVGVLPRGDLGQDRLDPIFAEDASVLERKGGDDRAGRISSSI